MLRRFRLHLLTSSKMRCPWWSNQSRSCVEVKSSTSESDKSRKTSWCCLICISLAACFHLQRRPRCSPISTSLK